MNGDVQWTRTRLLCQRFKIQHHTAATLSTFASPSAHFSHVYVNLVDLLPPSNVFFLFLTCIDRFTHLLEAIPLHKDLSPTGCLVLVFPTSLLLIVASSLRVIFLLPLPICLEVLSPYCQWSCGAFSPPTKILTEGHQ